LKIVVNVDFRRLSESKLLACGPAYENAVDLALTCEYDSAKKRNAETT